MKRAETVEEYLSRVPAAHRAALERVRKAVRAAAPAAEERIAYQMPAFYVGKRPLVGYASFKDHCSFFPMSAAVVEAHREELADFHAAKGTLHFTPERPIPAAALKRMVRERLAEIGAD